MLGNKRKNNQVRHGLLFIIPCILIGITICVREVLPIVSGDIQDLFKITPPEIKQPAKKRVLQVAQEVVDLYPVIFQIKPGSTVIVANFTESLYYNIDLIGRDIVSNKMEPQNPIENYIITVSLSEKNQLVESKWTFIEKIDLVMHDTFISRGSTLNVHYSAPSTYSGLIGIRMIYGSVDINRIIMSSVR